MDRVCLHQARLRYRFGESDNYGGYAGLSGTSSFLIDTTAGALWHFNKSMACAWISAISAIPSVCRRHHFTDVVPLTFLAQSE